MSFDQFVLKEQYRRVEGLGDRLALMKREIEWEPFRPIIKCVYFDDKVIGGRPHTDEVLISRALLLQGLYGLSDEELEFQCNDRLSFRSFLGFPDKVPDFSTIWQARERLKAAGKDRAVWDELQRQLDAKGYKIEKGVIQDATIIEAEYGRSRRSEEKKAEREEREIEYKPKQVAHMDKDGSFTVKHGQVHYGYKLHTKCDVKHGLIRSLATTTAKDHDATVNLVGKEDGKAYRDKGYFGTRLPNGVCDMTMSRATRGHPLPKAAEERNKAIGKKRSPGERPYALIKEVFHAGVTFVTTLERVHVKNMLACFAYNLYQLVTLRRRKLARAL
jgi:transposase, IS5 family